MKSSKKLSLISFILFMFVASQFAMTASSRLVTPKLAITGNQAIIVIRHGKDLDEWIKKQEKLTDYWKTIAPNWPIYNETPEIFNKFIPGTETHKSVTVQQTVGHGLSSTVGESTGGESQAKRLQEKLCDILASATVAQFGPFAPVTRAITINPSIDGATQNPFDTIYPFLKNDKTFRDSSSDVNRNLLLVNNQEDKTVAPSPPITLSHSSTKTHKFIVANGLQEMINNNTLLPSDGGSVLLCWDGEGLWGAEKKTVGTETRRVFNPNSILAQLAGNVVADQMAMEDFYDDFYCAKGAMVYIFTNATNSNTKYNTSIYSSSWPAGQTSGLGVLTWRATWNSNDSATGAPVTTTEVVAGEHQMEVRD